MLGMLIAVGLILSPLTAPAVSPATPVPTEKITLDIKTINGSGCPAGTADASADVASDNTSFTVHYRNFKARVGADAPATDFRKNCQINVLVHVPQGFTYAVAKVGYRGFAHLENGASALEQANYYFSGTSPTARVAHTLTGPFHGTWEMTDSAEALIYAPCDVERNLNINAELRTNAGSSAPEAGSFIEMDTEHASVDTIYHFSWKKC